MYINGHHLLLGGDWLHAVEYGGCTCQKSGKYSYCSPQSVLSSSFLLMDLELKWSIIFFLLYGHVVYHGS